MFAAALILHARFARSESVCDSAAGCLQWYPEGEEERTRPGQPAGVSTSQPAGVGLAVRSYCSHNDIAAADRERQMLWKARWRPAQRQGFWRQPSGYSGSLGSQEVLACLPELRRAPSVRTDTHGGQPQDSRSGGGAAGTSPQHGSSRGDVARGTIDSEVQGLQVGFRAPSRMLASARAHCRTPACPVHCSAPEPRGDRRAEHGRSTWSIYM